MTNLPAYGHWDQVIVSSAIMLIFAFSFFRPSTQRDWRTFGTFSAFVVALFAEMYGFPLTVYLLSGWLSRQFPGIDWFSHDSSHLLQTLLGWRGDAHLSLLHFLSNLMVIGGLVLLAVSWKALFRAQQNEQLATTGPYAKIRHPQYAGFMLIMVGFLIQWPTLPTLLMFPVMVWVYFRLASKEEREVGKKFGDIYIRYVENTPRFFPRLSEIGSFGKTPHIISKL